VSLRDRLAEIRRTEQEPARCTVCGQLQQNGKLWVDGKHGFLEGCVDALGKKVSELEKRGAA